MILLKSKEEIDHMRAANGIVAEILSEIRKAGIAVEPQKPIPSGAFDYTGEFKDVDWPTKGLSPVNAKLK